MIKVISFDVDGTLVDSSFADRVWLEGVPALYARKYGTDLETAQRILMKEYEKVGQDDLRWYELRYWFDYFELEGTPRTFLQHYKDEIKIYEEVPEVLGRLSKKYRLIVASNAHRDFLSLTLPRIEVYFDHIFSVTSDFRLARKYEEFYLKILRQLQVSPGELVHVGDELRFDYEVPLQVGINALFLDRKGGKGLKDLREVEEKIVELE